jgi:hypothetical protein
MGSTVSGNRAAADGGGIYDATGGADSLTTSTLSGNHAAGYGGGIYNQGYSSFWSYPSSLAAAGTQIIRNRASGGGGGIYDGPDMIVMLTNSQVTGNKPDNCEPPGSITGCTG